MASQTLLEQLAGTPAGLTSSYALGRQQSFGASQLQAPGRTLPGFYEAEARAKVRDMQNYAKWAEEKKPKTILDELQQEVDEWLENTI